MLHANAVHRPCTTPSGDTRRVPDERDQGDADNGSERRPIEDETSVSFVMNRSQAVAPARDTVGEIPEGACGTDQYAREC